MYAAPFTIERGRAALAAILSAFETPPQQGRILAAKQDAGNSMIRYQQIVFPLCTEIQLGVIAGFGFQPDGEGILEENQFYYDNIKQTQIHQASFSSLNTSR